ncbi:MAG: disulfide bond formation protein B [Candidatus Zambryskibacteria bacterium]|nr:disulfide bond formation protein B [Candidatus Zambryskibacteria bacterium]
MIHFIQTHITFFVTTLTLVSHIVFIVVLTLLIIERKFRIWIYNFVYKYIIQLLFLASLGAAIGSLSYSEIVGFPPCDLCWIQRIFMYPQAILAFVAMIKKDKNIVDYLLPLSILGAIVSFYQSLVNWGLEGSLVGCTSVGGECARVYVLEYGYITIPFMAFTVFAYLIGLSIVYYKSKNGREQKD